MTKIAGSGFISQRHGSADPDPHQNVMDMQHCLKCWVRQKTTRLGVCELEYLPHPFPPPPPLGVCFEGQQKLQVPHSFMAQAAKVGCSLFYRLNFPNL
jgi:hypothetical protein